MSLLSILLFIITVFIVLHFFVQWRYFYWKRRGVPFVKPSFPFGNFQGIGTRVHIGTVFANYYNQFKGKFPYCGVYMFINPLAIATDLDLLKNILIKDFNYFADRGIYHNEKDDPLSYNLFTMEGIRWRLLRGKLSPAFTSGKMKMMFPIMADIGLQLKQCVDRAIEKNSEIEMKDIFSRYTTDMIGSCVFGLESKSLEDSENMFNKTGRKFFNEPRLDGFKLFLVAAFTNFCRKLKIKMIADDVSEFYTNIVKQTISHREENDIKRNDLLNLMLQLKNKGKLDDDLSETKSDFITTQEIINQSFVFFVAGFETSSTTMAFALNELVANLEIQEKLRYEIQVILNKHDGQITYDSITEMKYLEQVLYETLRKYPVFPIINRITVADYLVPGTTTTIEKGRKVFIPVYGIHHDLEHYPDPEKFDPDRFTADAIQQRHSMAFLPFGNGPRNCLGQRFGLMQTKIGLVTLLMHYRFKMTDKTNYPISFNLKSFSFMLAIKGGVHLHAEPI